MHLSRTYSTKSYSIILLICICLLLSACGFKLRGAYQLPIEMQTTYVKSAAESTLVRRLKRSLKASNINIVDEKTAASAVLNIEKESRSKRTVSVDSQGRAREYTLTYSVEFSVSAQHSNFEINQEKISLQRDFLFDTEDVLGKSKGESQLYEEMQQDLVRLIMLRLQSKRQIK